METADEETLLAHLNPPSQVASEYARDGSVDIKKQPALKQSTGKWRACYFILGVEFCESMAYAAICTNLVTYLTTVLHERKVDAARNFSAWLGACFLSPLLGAFIADTYLGRYWTIVVSVPLYIIGMLVLIVSASLPVFSTSHGDGVHSSVVYLGLYLLAISNGGLKPCISTFGADQFDTNDPVELAQKGSFFNWYFFLTSSSSLLSGTVIVWLEDNVGWAVGYIIPTVLMLFFFVVFITGSKVYRFRGTEASPLTSIFQVLVAAVRKSHLQLPDDSSLLYELTTSSPTADASHKSKHSNRFRFLDKAAIAPSDNESMVQMSPWRVCTVTQVEELKMLLSMSPIWGSFVIFYAVATQMQSTLVEQGMFMDNHVGSFAIPPASMPIVSVCSFLIWVPIYETILIPFARRFTGKEKGFSQSQRLGIGQALSTLTMVLAAMLETRRLAIAEANGLRDQDVPVPISILWQGPLYLVHGASAVFGGIGLTEFFYDEAPVTMRSLCAALGQLATAAGSYFSSAILSIVAVATTRDGAPGWIPDNLNEGHLDYFFWMMATLSLLNFALFVGYSMRPKGREYF
ncbi:hypothetical protein HU200_042108 [Digitaria exilis]|uniref:Peptide transporter n=1 Tax=Digitaria exilis TaxID=1010633 RepID=A0A835EF71_9POAL|nr:hypothetical protein HU200_042108 [Digitaria exilis]